MQSDALKMIEAGWFLIREKFDDLYQAAPDSNARARLLAERDGARDAYYLALSHAFDDADAYVIQTTAALKAAKKALGDQLQDLKDIVAALALVTSVVNLIAALAAMGF